MIVFERYRRDLDVERRRVASLPWRSANTSFGPIEYLDRGEGAPVFVVHGITQAADGGLRDLAEEVVPNGYRLIIPSRFGYLGSAMPENPSVEAQADAFAELMDMLGMEAAVVVAASAGSTSALHLAIRHPERVRGLVLVSANVPGSHQLKGMPPKPVFRSIFGSDPILWALITYAPGLIARLSKVLVVPEGVDLVPGDEDKVVRAMRNVLLAKRRVAGELFDAYVSNLEVNRIELTQVQAPTLILHARDDPGPPYASAVEMSHHIPDAQLIPVESGGHMLLGTHADELKEVARFIEDHSEVPSDLAR